MATRARAVLPAIGTRDQDNYNVGPWQHPTPRADSRSYSRLEYLEDRIVQQESTTRNLIDRAYKIKEDIIDNLSITHGTWQEEKRARELLQEHIRTITDVVRKLSTDIVVVEEQMKTKDGYTQGTQHAVMNLEMHHVAGLTDLRGRVARCDASIARLSADLKTCVDSIKSLNTQQQDANTRVMDRIGVLDSKFGDLLSRLERQSSDNNVQLQNVESDVHHQLGTLDARTQSMVDDIRTAINSYKVSEEMERDKFERHLSEQIGTVKTSHDSKLDKLERKIEDALSSLRKHVNILETDLQQVQDTSASSQQALESRISVVMDAHVRSQGQEVSKLKRECREGFSTVHESITNMKQVLDGKQKLLEEHIRKDISQIRKMVVLI